jgi:hypothetical protein
MKVQILGIGGDPVILQTLLRCIIDHPQWEVTGTVSEEDAITIFHQRKFDIILFTTGIEEQVMRKLTSLFTFQNPDIIFIKHFMGECGLLFYEIQEALEKKNENESADKIKKPINVVDDIFKNENDK